MLPTEVQEEDSPSQEANLSEVPCRRCGRGQCSGAVSGVRGRRGCGTRGGRNRGHPRGAGHGHPGGQRVVVGCHIDPWRGRRQAVGSIGEHVVAVVHGCHSGYKKTHLRTNCQLEEDHPGKYIITSIQTHWESGFTQHTRKWHLISWVEKKKANPKQKKKGSY